MKVLLFVLLSAALCVQMAHSLTCYECSSQSSNDNCKTPKNCSSGAESFCMTTVSHFAIVGTSIQKECTAACTQSNVVFLGQGVIVSCCNTNLCNVNATFNGAHGSKASFTVLVSAVVFIGLLFTY
ncbi:lymphocyte antigen 6E-like [Pleurodeles waltl]|uniref:lymphocyte antigen 6E-like n=1 Tax=Pleurodeles waltl TaxID=8319 RepID=UPI0037095461